MKEYYASRLYGYTTPIQWFVLKDHKFYGQCIMEDKEVILDQEEILSLYTRLPDVLYAKPIAIPKYHRT